MLITIDQRDMRQVYAMLDGIGKAGKSVLRSALRSTLSEARQRASKAVASELNLKVSRIKADMETIGPYESADGMQAKLKTTSRPPNYIEFGAKQIKRGVSVKVTKGGKRKKIPHAFIAPMPGKKSGEKNTLVAIRSSDIHAPRKGYVPFTKFEYANLPDIYRLPIKTLFGPRVADVLARPAVMRPLEEYFAARMGQILIERAEKQLNKFRASNG